MAFCYFQSGSCAGVILTIPVPITFNVGICNHRNLPVKGSLLFTYKSLVTGFGEQQQRYRRVRFPALLLKLFIRLPLKTVPSSRVIEGILPVNFVINMARRLHHCGLLSSARAVSAGCTPVYKIISAVSTRSKRVIKSRTALDKPSRPL